MNLLHLEASPGWGGQEMRILKEAEGMRAKGHFVCICVMKRGRLAVYAKKAGFTVMELNFHKKAWIFSFFILLYWIYKYEIDLINTHSSLDSWLGGFAGKLARLPVVRTRHLSTPVKSGWNSRILYHRLADFVVTTCEQIIPTLAKQSGKPIHFFQSIATGVDPGMMKVDPAASQQVRLNLGLDPNDFLIGTVCFIRSWKGIDDLLDAACLLRDEPSIKWIIIGGGHAEKYQKRALSLGLERIVFFTGHLENPFSFLKALDVFTLLSTAHEGVSQAILQAAYFQKPLIATSTGGLQEVCVDGITGIQVSPFSPQEVGAAVLKLKQNPVLRKQYGMEAKKKVETCFLLKQTIDEMEKVYNKVKKIK